MRVGAGFTLIEVLLALSLGLMLLLAAGRVFVGALHSWQTQDIAAQMQEEARLVLQRMVRDIRMAGAFGCLRHEAMTFADPASSVAFARPVTVQLQANGNLDSLTLISAQAGDLGGAPDWTLITNCGTTAKVAKGNATPGPGEYAIPLRCQVYRIEGDDLILASGGSNARLIGGIKQLGVEQGDGVLALSLTLADPQHRVRIQTYTAAVALRNGQS